MTDTPPPAADTTGLALDDRLRSVGDCVRAGDMPRAFVLAREGLDLGQEHPGLLGLRAFWLEQQGQYEAALLDLERALELAPREAATLNAKGLVLDKLQRPREAAAAFQATTEIAPRFAPAFHNLGWASEMIGDLDSARNAHEQALALKPDYVEPLAHLARLSLRRGDPNSARVHAGQALRIDPDCAAALTAYAEAELKEGDPAQAETQLRRVLAGDKATPLDRGAGLKLLGDALDAQGRYAEAFEAYTEGNRELKALYAPRLAAGRGQTVPEMLIWLLNYMNQTTEQAWAPRPPAGSAPDAPAAHLFITGFPRSGSDFLANALAADPSTVLLRSHDALGEAVRDFMVDAADLDHLARAAEADLEPYRRAYWRRAREAGVEPAGKLFVDCLALNVVRAPVIARLFPKAATLFTLRDPRDVVLSCFRGRFQMNPTMYEFSLPRHGGASLRPDDAAGPALSREAAVLARLDPLRRPGRQSRGADRLDLRLCRGGDQRRDARLRRSRKRQGGDFGSGGARLLRRNRGTLAPTPGASLPWGRFWRLGLSCSAMPPNDRGHRMSGPVVMDSEGATG